MTDGSPDWKSRPFVSVVLPIRNEQESIDECLSRLLQQDYPALRYEIIVVDGRSSDETRARVRTIQDAVGSHRLRLLDNPKEIVPSALNIGIRAARGEMVIRMDGHTFPAPDYISACVRVMDESGATNVGGPMVPVGDTPFGEAVSVALQHPAGVGDAAFHFPEASGFVETVYLGAFHKEIFLEAGLFDESLVRNQDDEMNVRIRKAGGSIYLDPRIRSTYKPRRSFGKLWRQYFEYGWWRVETGRRHFDQLRWRQLLPALFVAALLLTAVASPIVAAARVGLALLAGPYLSALIFTAITVVGKVRPGVAARVPVALLAMHLGYGSGFLLSLTSGGLFPYRAAPPDVPDLRNVAPDLTEQHSVAV